MQYYVREIYWSVILKERRGEYMGKPSSLSRISPTKSRKTCFVSRKPPVGRRHYGNRRHSRRYGIPAFFGCSPSAQWETGGGKLRAYPLTLVPYIPAPAQIKTKPTQHSVRELPPSASKPDIIVCARISALAGRQKEARAFLQRGRGLRHRNRMYQRCMKCL
jgi:CTP synthase